MRQPLILTVLSLLLGLIVSFAFAPHSYYFVEIFSLGAMLGLARARSRKMASLMWFCFGIGMFGYGVWWIQVSVHQFGLPLYSFSVSVTAALIIVQALHIGIFGWMSHPFLQSKDWRVAIAGVPVSWVLIEFLRGWFGSGFPWLLLGYAHVESMLGALAPIGGVHLVSYAVVFLTTSLISLSVHRKPTPLILAGMLIATAYGLRFTAWSEPIEAGTRQVGLVQAAIPQEIKWHPDVREPSINLYRQLSENLWDTDVVIWPETAIPAFPDEVPNTLTELAERASSEKATLLVGMATRDKPDVKVGRRIYFNSLIKVGDANVSKVSASVESNATNIAASYNKRHLVPFGEYMPFDAVLRPITDKLNVPMSDFSSGKSENVTIRANDMIFGVSICYEDAYAQLLRDALPSANVLVNISNDAWFGDTIAPHQHLQISQMRARELARFMLRATNTGISAIIDEQGRVIAKSEQFEPEVLRGEFKLLGGQTPYARFGAAPILCFSLLTYMLIWLRSRQLAR